MSRRIIFLLLACFLSGTLTSGGDYGVYKVDSIVENGDISIIYLFVVRKPSSLLDDCERIKLSIDYERVPWFSFLPFVHTNHPSADDTETALNFLHRGMNESSEIYLGYVGSSMLSAGECDYLGKGLRVELFGDEKYEAVVVF